MTTLRTVPGYLDLVCARILCSTILWIDFTLIFSSLTYFWKAEELMIGVASAMYGLPGLIFGPYFGSLADRLSPIRILGFGYSARALSSGLMVIAPNLESFVVLVLMKGLSNLGVAPAEQALLKSMLTNDQLVSNARTMTILDQLLKICAPLLGAALASLYWPSAGFGLSTILALAALLFLARLKQRLSIPLLSKQNRGSRRRFVDIRQLFQGCRAFRLALIATLSQTLVLGLYDPLLALFLKELGQPASTFGIIVSCTAGGAIFGAMLFKRIYALEPARLISISLIGFGATVVVPSLMRVLSSPISASMLFGCWALNGCCYGITSMSFSVIMQQNTPAHSIGTVSSTARSLQLAMLVLGPLVGASIAQQLGLIIVFILSGAVAIMTGASIGMHRFSGR